ncbi:hypothetical protein CEP53_006913 [Fusarium sp. AF-6]|nr:hypothetical protein CEP53_006913 [Fusarium sp. AF-6]
MASNEAAEKSGNFVLTAETLDESLPKFHFGTQAVHADDFVSAPFDSHAYSRYTAPNSSRLEIVLKTLFGTSVVSYSSGLSAFHVMLVLVNPKRIFLTEGYHDVHGVIDVISQLNGLKKLSLNDIGQMGPGDMLHVETPLNPTGEAQSLAYYKERACAVGAILTVDSTFGPPPLQDPLQFGADMVMHSGTNKGENLLVIGVSIGVEDLEDMKADFTQAFEALLAEDS